MSEHALASDWSVKRTLPIVITVPIRGEGEKERERDNQPDDDTIVYCVQEISKRVREREREFQNAVQVDLMNGNERRAD